MFFVKILVSARLPGASVLYGGGVPDAPGTLLQPHTSRRHEGMPPYIPPYKQTVGRGALTPPRRGQDSALQSSPKRGFIPKKERRTFALCENSSLFFSFISPPAAHTPLSA